jgi:hypothetical protein
MRGNSENELWKYNVDPTESCTTCKQSDCLFYLKRDGIVALFVQKLISKGVEFELHYHWFEAEPYILYVSWKSAQKQKQKTFTGRLPEDAFDACLRFVS